MVERPDRDRVDDGDRAPRGREWEVFVRESAGEPLHHAGSVRAPTPDDAHDLASRLFAWYASDLWICPSAAVSRYTSHDLAEERRPASDPTGEEPRTREWS
ncbi:rSAM-partnered protein [Natronomonas salina]|uniref:Htur_1727 family rSAM-partnered candidate RiPP n=1 Tax=Natronomonas salina TaxID=1710540 RepID=UPI0015B7216A|nr:Htur_1727 family rSAM-partnered candidate RiPP [Natronomonas salina]QLD91050.1 rSAM-partnered protein [Natronomonas salina]